MKEDKIVGHVHAVQMVVGVHNKKTMLQSALFRIIDEELDVQLGSPPAACVQQLNDVVANTLIRKQTVVNASVGSDETGVPKNKSK